MRFPISVSAETGDRGAGFDFLLIKRRAILVIAVCLVSRVVSYAESLETLAVTVEGVLRKFAVRWWLYQKRIFEAAWVCF